MIPAEENINLLKIGAFALTITLVAVWMANEILKRRNIFKQPEYRYIFLFIFYLFISPIIGEINGSFQPLDWARDIAPFLNLLLIPVLTIYFKKRKIDFLYI